MGLLKRAFRLAGKHPACRGCKDVPLKIHETKRYIRERMVEPGKFDPRSFRTIDPGRKGHTKLVVGCPKGKYEKGRCQVGMKTQAVIHEKHKGR